jgi:hypothetical protein
MSTARVVGLMIAWILASVMIAVVTAIVATEVLRVLGFVETGEPSYATAINVVFGVTLIALIAVPFVFRRRFGRLGEGDQ